MDSKPSAHHVPREQGSVFARDDKGEGDAVMTCNNASNVTLPFARWIKLAGFVVFAAALMTISPTVASAQPAARDEASGPSTLAVPTTKLLAIGSLTSKAMPELLMAILPSEASETVRLYLAGKISRTRGEVDYIATSSPDMIRISKSLN
jgi:hypothetical protein